MGLILKVNSGPLQGQTFPVQRETVIGRQGAQININDPRVSTVHARITKAGGQWLVLDNASKNGVRNDKGERVDSLPLKPGTIFYIGDSGFEVQESSLEIMPAIAVIQEKLPEDLDPRRKQKKPRYWNDVLAEFLEEKSDKFRENLVPLMPLEPALILEFVRGVQVSSKWILGYGPRQIGSAALDLPIWEPGAPEVCFEVLPSPDGIIFKTSHPGLVQLNGQGMDNEVLRMGDTIKIKDTLIEVDFVE